MTDPRTFHFAVKPGREPVQLPSLSAHDTLPWVARDYEFKIVYAYIEGNSVTCWSDGPQSAEDFQALAAAVMDCVAKCVAKLGTFEMKILNRYT